MLGGVRVGGGGCKTLRQQLMMAAGRGVRLGECTLASLISKMNDGLLTVSDKRRKL